MNKQDEIGKWHKSIFPTATPEDILCKLTEEVGELCHARQHNKWTNSESSINEIDAIGDILVVLTAYCAMRCIDMEQAFEWVWSIVKERSTKRLLSGQDD